MSVADTDAAEGSHPDADVDIDETESPSVEQADTEDEPESPSDETAAEADPENDEPKEFANALGKFKGDKAKLGSDYWRTQQRAAELAKENAELKAKLSGKVPPAEEKKPAPAFVPPQIQALEDEISALSQERASIYTEAVEVAKEHGELSKVVTKLEARLESAEDFDKPAIAEKLEAAKRERRAVEKQHASLRREADRLDRDGVRVREQIALETARQQSAQTERETFKQDFRSEVDSLISAAASGFQVKDPELLEELHEVVNSHLIRLYSPYHLKGVDASTVDHEAAIKARVAQWAKRNGIVKKVAFTQRSEKKLEVTRPVPRRTATPQVPEPRNTSQPGLPKSEIGRLAILERADKRARAMGL